MFLSYLDSSGRPQFTEKEDFVVTSVTVNEAQWHYIRDQITAVKQKHFPLKDPDKIELHAKEMMNRTGKYKGLSWEKIFNVLYDVFKVISDNDTKLTIISSLIKKSELYKHIDVELWGHRFVFERLNRFLFDKNRILEQADRPHEYGIMIMDTEGHRKDQNLRDKLRDMLNEGTHYSSLGYLIEDPLFTDSKWRNLSQIADCVAYCIRKNFRNNNNTDQTANWKKYYSMIEKKFHNEDDKYLGIGLKIFP